jgi:hypothetical protein
VRFIVAAGYRADVTAPREFAAGDLNGCAGLLVATQGPIGSDRGWRSVAIGLAVSPDSYSRSCRLDDPAATCDGQQWDGSSIDR